MVSELVSTPELIAFRIHLTSVLEVTKQYHEYLGYNVTPYDDNGYSQVETGCVPTQMKFYL